MSFIRAMIALTGLLALVGCAASGPAPTTVQLAIAGTADMNAQVMVSGGRVLCVTALGSTVADAQTRAYAVVDGVQFDGMQYRRDIGFRAL